MNRYFFTSSLFKVEPGEDEEINPGRYGRQLASWLKAQLEQRGYSVEPVISEDWGRCLMLSRRPYLLWVGCGNIDEPMRGASSTSEIVWHCFACAEIPLLRRIFGFGKPDTTVALAKLDADLHAILSAEPTVVLAADL